MRTSEIIYPKPFRTMSKCLNKREVDVLTNDLVFENNRTLSFRQVIDMTVAVSR